MTTGQKFIHEHQAQLLELCHRYPVERLYFFGSVLTNRFEPEKSDVDVQVFFDRMADGTEMGLSMLEFWDELEAIFNRKVDLLTKPEIRNPIFKNEVESTRQLFYEHRSEEISA